MKAPGNKQTPPPLEAGGWGEGCVGSSHQPTPPPNPLAQGEGESSSIHPGLRSFIQGDSATSRRFARKDSERAPTEIAREPPQR